MGINRLIRTRTASIDPTDIYRGPLDLIRTRAAAAYSTRKLDVNYIGPALRVRRSSDSAEQDILFDSAGNLDQTQLIRFVGKNMIQNSSTTGAVIGTPGTLPNNWFAPTTNLGLNRTVVGFGTAGGLPYVDVRYNGVLSGAGDTTITPATNNSIVAATGETWVHSVTLSVVAGALPVSVNTRIGLIENNGAGAFLASSANTFGSAAITATPTQFTLTRLFNQATTAFAQVAININATASDIGNTIDFTLRIAGWQLERNSLSSFFNTTGNAAGGGFVTRWYDQSGNAKNATQSNASLQPMVMRNGVVRAVNSRASVSGNSSTAPSSYLDALSVAPVVASPDFNLLAVVGGNQGVNIRRVLQLSDSAGTAGKTIAADVGDVFGYRFNNGNELFNNNDDQPHVGFWSRPANGDYVSGDFYQDGTLQSATSNSNPTGTLALDTMDLTIGAGRLTTPVEWLSAEYAEVILFLAPISAAERNAITRNAGSYYGITVA